MDAFFVVFKGYDVLALVHYRDFLHLSVHKVERASVSIFFLEFFRPKAFEIKGIQEKYLRIAPEVSDKLRYQPVGLLVAPVIHLLHGLAVEGDARSDFCQIVFATGFDVFREQSGFRPHAVSRYKGRLVVHRRQGLDHQLHVGIHIGGAGISEAQNLTDFSFGITFRAVEGQSQAITHAQRRYTKVRRLRRSRLAEEVDGKIEEVGIQLLHVHRGEVNFHSRVRSRDSTLITASRQEQKACAKVKEKLFHVL